MSDEEREATMRAIGRSRDTAFADLLTLAIGLAAETHPEEIRKALASVFDVKVIEERASRAVQICTEAQAKTHEVASILRDMNDELEKLEARIDALNTALNSVAKRVANAVRWAQKLREVRR